MLIRSNVIEYIIRIRLLYIKISLECKKLLLNNLTIEIIINKKIIDIKIDIDNRQEINSGFCKCNSIN